MLIPAACQPLLPASASPLTHKSMPRPAAHWMLVCLVAAASSHSSWSKTDYRPKILSRNELSVLADYSQNAQDRFNETLRNILVPRVSGTDGNGRVFDFIKSHYQQLDWFVEEDLFSANTPFGPKGFRNLIVTLNPRACKRLVFACHFDSKYFENGNFLGATDSAVPCSMMMTMASDLNRFLQSHRQSDPRGTTLQFIFFDGEEAFVEWSATDSLYGSRHLVEKWNKTPVRPAGVCDAQGDVSEIDRIELFVLLDLLGASNPSFYSYFPETDVYYARMMSIEQTLNSNGLMSSSSRKATSYFKNRRSFGMIEDDHIPFMRKGVKIVHVIASPFPAVWHKMTDNESALHHATISNLMTIFKSFIAEYLHLDVAS